MTFRPGGRPFGRRRLNRPYWLGVAAMLLVAGSAFLPWVSFGGAKVDGVEFMDGRITLVMAVGGLVATAFGTQALGTRLTPSGRMVLSSIFGAIAVFTSSGDLSQVAGAGLWLTLAGSLLWIFAVIWEYNEGKRLNW